MTRVFELVMTPLYVSDDGDNEAKECVLETVLSLGNFSIARNVSVSSDLRHVNPIS
jgi:hypothetical protein